VAALDLARALAQRLLDDLRTAGHVEFIDGGIDEVVRDFSARISPALPRLLPHAGTGPMMGEITSTFGHDDADEAAEELVEELRDALLDADGVDEVFADDRTIDRAMFRSLARGVPAVAQQAELEGDDPRVAIDFARMGYVGAQAAKHADADTLRDALERAADDVKVTLDVVDAAAGLAMFVSDIDDPALEAELLSTIEEQLVELVELGLVDLPPIERVVSLEGDPLDRAPLRRALDGLVARHLVSDHGTGSWELRGDRAVALLFTPLAEPDTRAIDAMFAAAAAALPTVLDDARAAPVSSKAPRSSPAPTTAARSTSREPAPSTPRPLSTEDEDVGLQALFAAIAGPQSSSPESSPAPASVRGRTVKPSVKGEPDIASTAPRSPTKRAKSAKPATAASAAPDGPAPKPRRSRG
jgi:hypothetical protein